MIVDRRDLADHVQRRPPPRRARATLGRFRVARARPADVDGLSAAEPLPHRRHARDVHARRLHARRRLDDHRLVRQRLQRREAYGGGFDVRATSSPRRRRSPTCAPALRHAPRPRPADFRLVAAKSTLAGQGEPARSAVKPEDLHRSRPRLGVPRAHDATASPRTRRATPPPPPSGGRCGRRPGLAVVDAFVVPRQTNYASGPPRPFQSARLLSRGQDVRPGDRRRCATRRPATHVGSR